MTDVLENYENLNSQSAIKDWIP